MVLVTNGPDSEGIEINGAGSKQLYRGTSTPCLIQLWNLLPQNFMDATSLYRSINIKENSWRKRITHGYQAQSYQLQSRKVQLRGGWRLEARMG